MHSPTDDSTIETEATSDKKVDEKVDEKVDKKVDENDFIKFTQDCKIEIPVNNKTFLVALQIFARGLPKYGPNFYLRLWSQMSNGSLIKSIYNVRFTDHPDPAIDSIIQEIDSNKKIKIQKGSVGKILKIGSDGKVYLSFVETKYSINDKKIHGRFTFEYPRRPPAEDDELFVIDRKYFKKHPFNLALQNPKTALAGLGVAGAVLGAGSRLLIDEYDLFGGKKRNKIKKRKTKRRRTNRRITNRRKTKRRR
jgi:hypothetical protein